MTTPATGAPAVDVDWPRPGDGDFCLFLDRDGVVNRRVVGDYVRSWEDFEFLPGAAAAIAHLSRWAPWTVVVTNQQGVGKGLVTPAALADVHDRMRAAVEAEGGRIDEFLVCPHLATDGCECRKPRAGLALGWLARHPDVRASRCVVVGDSETDLLMGREATGGRGLNVWIPEAGQPLDAVRPELYDVVLPSLDALASLVPAP